MLAEATDCANRPPLLTSKPMEAANMAEQTIFRLGAESKACTRCGETKSLSEYYFDKRDGRHSGQCKVCRVKKTGEYQRNNPEVARAAQMRSRAKNPEKYRLKSKLWLANNPEKAKAIHKRAARRSLLKRYGMTQADLVRVFEEQRGGCAICASPIHLDGGRHVHFDHCHKTQKFRGILCLLCNTGLGKFKDSPDILEKAALYLKKADDEKRVQFRGELIRV